MALSDAGTNGAATRTRAATSPVANEPATIRPMRQVRPAVRPAVRTDVGSTGELTAVVMTSLLRVCGAVQSWPRAACSPRRNGRDGCTGPTVMEVAVRPLSDRCPARGEDAQRAVRARGIE